MLEEIKDVVNLIAMGGTTVRAYVSAVIADHLKEWCGKSVDEITRDDVRAIITRWLDSVTALNHMLLDDARKEYSLQSRTGFGIDDPTGEADNDFVSVRGQFEADPFVKMVQDHIVTKTALAQSALALLG